VVYDGVVLGFKAGAVVLLIEVAVAVTFLYKLAFLVAFALIHLEVELLLVLELSLLLEILHHVLFLVVVLRPCLVVLLLLKQAQVGAVAWLGSLAVLAFGNPVLES
jgi:hypothetical protein